MKRKTVMLGVLSLSLIPGVILADVETYESLSEGFLGTSFTLGGVTYRDVNNVAGFYADGTPFVAGDPGTDLVVENATLFYNDFASYGSPINSLTFGRAFVPGDNLSIGALASVFMDFAGPINSASLDIAFYENGPWGNIEYHLDAISGGSVVASDSFTIADGGGRDSATWSTLTVGGATFDTLQLYATKNGSYTVPRGMIDDLTFSPVPEPATMLVLGLGALAVARRRRAKKTS